jgi:phenylcoumaran benzylic ether reductase
VDDPRTLNKILYLRPPKNIYSFNDVIALWEKKIGKTLEKFYVIEDKLLRDIEGWYILLSYTSVESYYNLNRIL